MLVSKSSQNLARHAAERVFVFLFSIFACPAHHLSSQRRVPGIGTSWCTDLLVGGAYFLAAVGGRAEWRRKTQIGRYKWNWGWRYLNVSAG